MTTLDIILRLLLAISLGGIIGLEREASHKPAGLRTHILICISAAMMMILSELLLAGNPAPTGDLHRVAAAVIMGMGFIGAGTIIQSQGTVHGLTTASELHSMHWVGSLPSAVVYVLIAVMFYIVYRHLTDAKPPRTAAIVSTVTMTVLWIVSAKLFAHYLSNFSAISTVYGGYAFILVLLVWVYYSSLVFVIGAMAGQVYWESKKPMLKQKAGGIPPGV